MLTIDTHPLHDLLEGWNHQQSAFDHDLDESMSALDAFQRHLEHWEKQLAAERSSIAEEKRKLGKEREELAKAPVPAAKDSIVELVEAQEAIHELRASLLERTDDLRKSDQKRSELVSELQLARSAQLEVEKKLESEKARHLEQQLHWTQEFQRACEQLEMLQSQVDLQTPESDDPGVGSVLAQFGKLRRQAADRRTRV